MERTLDLLASLLGLFGGPLFILIMPVVLISLTLRYVRTGKGGLALSVSAASMAGFVAGGVASWELRRFPWDLPFLTTLEASVNAQKYGHPVEHMGEGILVYLMFWSLVGACVLATLAATAARISTRHNAHRAQQT